jgi:hypothetical protein
VGERVAARGAAHAPPSGVFCRRHSPRQLTRVVHHPTTTRSGPKFQKLVRRSEAEGALQKYEPFIVASQNFP